MNDEQDIAFISWINMTSKFIYYFIILINYLAFKNKINWMTNEMRNDKIKV